jgi:ParB-like chromosome segregation protein Spo0J
MTVTLEFHPLANIFPLLEGAEFDELVADIVQRGLLEPITVHEDMVLDGRNRYRACQAAGVEPTFTVYTGDDPVSYVVSLNLRRRHLNESQRALVAAKLATLRDGQRADLVEGLPIGRASGMLNVGERTVARAREVLEHGAPELVSAVEHGKVSVSAAADVARQDVDEQREIVARGEREILRAAQDIRAEIAAPNALSAWPQPVTKTLHSQVTDAMRYFVPIRRGISRSTTKNLASSARPATTIPRCRSMRSALCQF